MKITESFISGQPIKAKGAGENHIARIDGHMARVFRRNGYESVQNRTPLSDLLKKEERADETDQEEAERRALWLMILQRVTAYFFADGPHPGKVMRRVYAVARAYYPDLILDMNGTDLAVIFDETRATVSARCNLMFTDYLKKRSGAKGNKVSFQKSAASSAKYARAAKGNQNRKGKKVARLARAAKKKA